MSYSGRLAALSGGLADQKLSALLVSRPENVRYLTGLAGHADFDYLLLVCTEARPLLLTNALYAEEGEKCAAENNFDLHIGRLGEALKQFSDTKASPVVLGFEGNHLAFALVEKLRGQHPEIDFQATTDLIERLRRQKDSEELNTLKTACAKTDEALQLLLPLVKPGVSELALKQFLQQIAFDLAADGFSFDPIIGAGPHSARPHHQPTARKIQSGELIQFDLGLRYQGYGADLSRVAVIGQPARRDAELYDTVAQVQRTTVEQIKPGMDGRELDTIARMAFEGKAFPVYPHGLGHGIGLDPHVHEAPTLSARHPQPQPLEEGVVFTIEPGSYLTGEAGVRVEDVLAIVDGKVEQLSQFPSGLISL